MRPKQAGVWAPHEGVVAAGRPSIPTPAPHPLQRVAMAAGGALTPLALAAGLWFGQASGVQASPASPLLAMTGTDPWPVWREAMLRQIQHDPASAVEQLRRHYELARRGELRHVQWLLLAWLTHETARTQPAACAPLVALATQALQAAQREGDKVAAFDLLIATASAELQLHLAPVNDARIAQAGALAAELGGPVREGLVGRLRGLAAQQGGQPGEAVVQFQRALPLLSHPLDRTELLLQLAQAELQSPAADSADRAAAALDAHAALAGSTGAESYLQRVDALALRSRVQVRQGRATQAVDTALKAASVARTVGLESPWARAQLALAHAYLEAGKPSLALDSYRAVPRASMSAAEQLEWFGGQALAMSRLQAPGALDLLRDGRALAGSGFMASSAAALRFHESAARAMQHLGDAAGALQELGEVTTQRATMLDRAHEKLIQARIDAAHGMANKAAHERQERTLLITNGTLVLALSVLAAMTAWHHQRRSRAARVARELETTNAQLEADNAARNHHLASACHDLRQPAHVIGQLADAMLHDPVSDLHTAKEHFASVGQCSNTLNDMLDALLDLSVLEQGRYTPRIEPVALGDLLAAVDVRYRRAAQEKGLTWLVSSSQAIVLTDRHLLGRVLLHLASNAVRYSTQGGIQILATQVGEHVQLEVADTGPGLPTDALLAPATADKPPMPGRNPQGLGTGLGLVREGCRLMGHDLAVPLSSPRGSVVRVTMRKVDAVRPGEGQPAGGTDGVTPHTAVAVAVAGVAVVEADPATRQAKAEALCSAGLRATSYASLAALQEARAAYPATGPAAVVLDLGDELMARGLERMQQWRQAFPDWRGPVLALTSDLRVDGLMRAAELGIHLACKPLSNVKLTELLQDLLHRKELEWQRWPGDDAAVTPRPYGPPSVHEARLP